MPLDTSASAAWRIRSSLTLHPNLFQLFHPIGGVFAKPLSSANEGHVIRRKPAASMRGPESQAYLIFANIGFQRVYDIEPGVNNRGRPNRRCSFLWGQPEAIHVRIVIHREDLPVRKGQAAEMHP